MNVPDVRVNVADVCMNAPYVCVTAPDGRHAADKADSLLAREKKGINKASGLLTREKTGVNKANSQLNKTKTARHRAPVSIQHKSDSAHPVRQDVAWPAASVEGENTAAHSCAAFELRFAVEHLAVYCWASLPFNPHNPLSQPLYPGLAQ